MSYKRKGQLTPSPEWMKHLRKDLKKQFWRGERNAERRLVKKELGDDENTQDRIQYTVNGLRLPPKLVTLIKADNWRVPSNKSRIKKALELPDSLRDRFDEFDDYSGFEVYSLGLMRSETLMALEWPKRTKSTDLGAMFLGAPDEKMKPGTIDVDKAVLIADLGPGSDTPFVLDYRNELDNPSVMIIYWGKDGISNNRWMKIADSFDEFIDVIGL